MACDFNCRRLATGDVVLIPCRVVAVAPLGAIYDEPSVEVEYILNTESQWPRERLMIKEEQLLRANLGDGFDISFEIDGQGTVTPKF